MSIYMQTRNEWDVANPVWYRLLGRILRFDVCVYVPMRTAPRPGAVCVLLVSPGQNFVTTPGAKPLTSPRCQATDVTPVPSHWRHPGAKVSFQPLDKTLWRHPGAKVSFQPLDKTLWRHPGAKPLTSPRSQATDVTPEPSHWRHPGAKPLTSPRCQATDVTPVPRFRHNPGEFEFTKSKSNKHKLRT